MTILNRNKAYFIDFDGVLVDSIDECYLTSSLAYYGEEAFSSLPVSEKNNIKKIFYKYRGLVGPANEFYVLHHLIQKINHHQLKENEIKSAFKLLNKSHQKFVEKFFRLRHNMQKINYKKWCALHKLTKFCKNISESVDKYNVYILTTKDKQSTELLISFFGLPFKLVLDKEDFFRHGDKGKVISWIMQKNNYTSAVFIDDSVDHLNSVSDPHVHCYFAPWGYGDNTETAAKQYDLTTDFFIKA